MLGMSGSAGSTPARLLQIALRVHGIKAFADLEMDGAGTASGADLLSRLHLIAFLDGQLDMPA